MKVSSRIGTIAGLALAAASTGVVVPVLRALVEHSGHGQIAAGVFMAAHVVGGVAGATCGTRALRRAGSARALAVAGLVASVAVTLALAAIDSFAIRVGLRFADGACHLLAITALVAAGTSGDAGSRAGRAVTLGLAIVLGVAGGLGIGSALDQPAAVLIVAALLTGSALVPVIAWVSGVPAPAAAPAAPAAAQVMPPDRRAALAPGMLAFCERFSFGSMTVAMPFLLPSAGRVGLVITAFMVASVAAMVVAWRRAQTWEPRKLAVRSALGFTLALALAAGIDVLTSPGLAVIWAIATGAAAGSLYASALVLATRSAALEDRARGMAAVHAAGSAGHALGALSAGTLAIALPGMLVIAVPGIAIIAAAVVGVWRTVPEAVRDCPVMSELTTRGDGAPRAPAAAPAPRS